MNTGTQEKVKLILGCASLIVGFLAANLALFFWTEETGTYYLLGSYARYVCAYGSFGAMIFGAMLINDFLKPKPKPEETKIIGLGSTSTPGLRPPRSEAALSRNRPVSAIQTQVSLSDPFAESESQTLTKKKKKVITTTETHSQT